jgi:hypothetical protein
MMLDYLIHKYSNSFAGQDFVFNKKTKRKNKTASFPSNCQNRNDQTQIEQNTHQSIGNTQEEKNHCKVNDNLKEN